ncbi:polyketide antibiotic transporter [Microbacterium sp. M3]|uniref:Polyketide antibiotic transporter n=1 Tax=Microbacterium arthrosphaerae TaxID=792652 RepID=A0ABU4H093_9MICO|nr:MULTISPECIES: polyketide antibiotic transporter [Microbacterium]MDW4572129.1 polyketide antibiotic transporter [Microbacterium arthrosphaerae]MDW7605984.1 polyketide antibiotic transporter [Microbacterium sp. M3]
MSRFVALLGQRARRDAVQVLLWAVGTALLAYASYVGVADAYGTPQDRTSLLAAALANPVILLFRGLPSGTGEGAFMVFLIFPWLALLAAFMSTFLAVRHTRGDEEAGRAELVAATPAARTLPFAATAVHGILANVLLGALTAGAFLAVGLDAHGSLLAGAAVGAVGVAFLGVGLFSAQLMRTSRGANGVAVWTLVLMFVVAGIGNAIGTPSDDLTRMESSWLTWLSPFGWGENTRAFDDNLWWPALLCVGAGAVLIAVSAVLVSARDLGGSFIAERRGRADASAALSTPTALVWRLTRGAVIGWTVGGLLVGLLSTSLASIVQDVGASNPAVEQILRQISGEGSIEQGTVTTFFTMLGVLAACAAVQVVCRARQEEVHGTAEPLLAAPVGRVRWLAGYLLVGLVAIVLVVAAAMAGAAAGIASQDGDMDLMRTVLVTGAGQVAAASVFLVVTALAFVLAPRVTIPLGWTLVLLGMTLGLFGPLFQFPEWLVHLSPIAVTPFVDGDEIDLRGLWWLVLAAGAGAAAALGLMRRRQLAAGG